MLFRSELVHDPDEEPIENCKVLSLLQCVLLIDDIARSAFDGCFDPRSVEWIPSVYGGRRWWMLRSRVMLAGVSEANSDLVRAKNGRVIEIHKLVVDADICRGHHFFRLSQGLESWGQVVSGAVRDRWLNSGFRGLSFFPIAT